VRIAVSSSGPGLDAQIDPRFGRCQYFVIVDSDSMQFEAVENPNVMATGGAGIQAAQLVADKGAQVVLTGNCGPNAFQTLKAAGIAVCVNVSGAVGEAVERYKRGEFQPVAGPSVGDKFGMKGGGSGGGGGAMGGGPGMGGGGGGVGGGGLGGGMGRGMGRGGMGMGRGMGRGGGGMGRGMGLGCGMGLGRGRGMGGGLGMGRGAWGAGMPGGIPGQEGPVSELEILKTEAETLKGQLDMISRRIEEIEKGGQR
jgi:predicted Fe-Mo cluster-binding NifX family protein